jgi:hypothetical protein
VEPQQASEEREQHQHTAVATKAASERTDAAAQEEGEEANGANSWHPTNSQWVLGRSGEPLPAAAAHSRAPRLCSAHCECLQLLGFSTPSLLAVTLTVCTCPLLFCPFVLQRPSLGCSALCLLGWRWPPGAACVSGRGGAAPAMCRPAAATGGRRMHMCESHPSAQHCPTLLYRCRLYHLIACLRT